MSKAVLISIRPEWCEKIASGQKTIEVIKTRPKIETPFKCYIYCTKPKIYDSNTSLFLDELYRLPSGEIKFGSSIELSSFPDQWNKDNFLNGKVIGEFVCESINEFVLIKPLKGAVDQNPKISSENGLFDIINIQMMAKLALPELIEYMGWHKSAYAWKISDLVIYDKPKELSSFCTGSSVFTFDDKGKRVYTGMKRPPQSWCYVEMRE